MVKILETIWSILTSVDMKSNIGERSKIVVESFKSCSFDSLALAAEIHNMTSKTMQRVDFATKGTWTQEPPPYIQPQQVAHFGSGILCYPNIHSDSELTLY